MTAGVEPGVETSGAAMAPLAGPRVALRSMGCRLNRVELDRIASELLAVGCQLVDEADAEAIVINSCAVTGEAETKCRKAVRHAARLEQRPAVVVCGCMATLFADATATLGERVHVVADKEAVAREVLSLVGDGAGACGVACAETCDVADARPDNLTTPTGRTRHGVKIQDGCDNRCSFCIVWKARGASRSVAPERVVAEVSEAVAHGAQEVVLSGINLGSYRWDEQGLRLPELLELLLERTEVGRLRLSSIEPPDVDAELLRVMAESGGRVAPFLHMCLQAGSDRTLRRMARVYDTALYRERVEMARERIEGLALGCDLIVGFPGETDADFEESLAFCREMAFAKMHVFRYSRRPGTPAASMPDQVDPRVMAQRSIRMRELADVSRATYAQSRLGCDELVLVQEPGRGVSGGLLDVLVDEGLALGSLARVRVRGIAGPDVLDARTSA